MGAKASEKTKNARKARQLKQAKRALRHAQARKRSPYTIKRISAHIKAVEQGIKPTAINERVKYRQLAQKDLSRQRGESKAAEAQENRERERIKVVKANKSESAEAA